MIRKRISLHLVIASLVIAPGASALAQTIWTGPDVVVDQPAGAPLSVVDVLIPGVASLTRNSTGLLCNTLNGDTCASFQAIPSDFEFAFSNLNGNGPIVYGSAANFANFTFSNMDSAFPNRVGNDLPNPQNGLPPVAGIGHHLSSDTYFDIEFSNWGQGPRGNNQPGAFTYRRSSAVPEPTSIALCTLLGTCVLASVRQRN